MQSTDEGIVLGVEPVRGDPGAMLELAYKALLVVDEWRQRLPPPIQERLATALFDLEMFASLERMDLIVPPPALAFAMANGRRFRYVDDMDGSEWGAAGTVVRFWEEDAKRGLKLGASLDLTRHGQLLHVSLSYAGHLPSWRDVREVKEHFFGDVDAMLVLPRAEDYVNVHAFTFHLWQIPARWALQ